MPGFITHVLAGREALKLLPPATVETIKKREKLYALGCQGPDVFFYNLPQVFSARMRGIGSVMHRNNLGPFLVEMAKKAREGKTSAIFTYTAGFLMHYAVDGACHPYICAASEHNTNTRMQNQSSHADFETRRDVEMLRELVGTRPYDEKIWTWIQGNRAAAKAMSGSIKDIYSRRITPEEVYNAMNLMCGITRLLQSKTGRWKKIFGCGEKLVLGVPNRSMLIHMQKLDEPTDTEFAKVFNTGTENGAALIRALAAYVYEGGGEDTLRAAIGNNSLLTGLPCEEAACA